MKPTRHYYDVIEAGKEHHRTSKTWSGSLAVRHAWRIKEFIDRIGAKSVLDYGCGKGIQYSAIFNDKPLEEFWGVPVTKVDPALPGDWLVKNKRSSKFKVVSDLNILSEPPKDQTWDLLVCTHVLGCIPPEDLNGWVVPMFHQIIKKGMYFAENLGPATKRVVTNEESKRAISRNWTPEQWVNAVTPKDKSLEVEFWFRGVDPALGAKFQRWPFDNKDDLWDTRPCE